MESRITANLKPERRVVLIIKNGNLEIEVYLVDIWART